MKLEKINVAELKKFKLAEYQRDTRSSKVNSLYKFFCEKGFFDSMPLLIDDDNNIVDGGHRAKAYIRAYDDKMVIDEVFVLIKNNANKETFLSVNKGTPVSINHKVKIHKITQLLERSGVALSSKTSSQSISYVDLARALAVVYRIRKNLNLKSSSQEEIFDCLNYFYESSDLMTTVSKIIMLKKMYFESLSKNTNKRFLQKLFLYMVSYSFKNGFLELSAVDKIVSRFPISLGGDIAVIYNKQLFVDAFNFNLKKESNKISINDI